MKRNSCFLIRSKLSDRSHDDREISCVRRVGIITLWAIVTIPIFLTALCVTLEVGNLWLGRIQLKNALESAALASAELWGEAGGGDTTVARIAGNAFSSACMVNGTPVDLTTIDATLNDNGANVDNDNTNLTGVLVFGVITSAAPEFVFDSATTTGCAVLIDSFAVRAQATFEVPSICKVVFGLPIGPFSVTARADAFFDCPSETPRLYHLEEVNFN